MAKILESRDFEQCRAAGRYPWDEWLDGKRRLLDSDDFGDAKAAYVAGQARTAALRRGKKIRVSFSDKTGTIDLQAFDMTDEEIAAEAKKAAARKEAKKTAKNEQQEEPTEQEQPAVEEQKKGRKGRK